MSARDSCLLRFLVARGCMRRSAVLHGDVVVTMNGPQVAALLGWKCHGVVFLLVWLFILPVALGFMGCSLSWAPLVWRFGL